MSKELLPLPEPDEYMQGRETAPGVYQSGYTAAQMREYALANLQAAKPADQFNGYTEEVSQSILNVPSLGYPYYIGD